MIVPVNTIVAKEPHLRGAFRFDSEFQLALRLMSEGLFGREAIDLGLDVIPERRRGIRPRKRSVESEEGPADFLKQRRLRKRV